MDYKNKISFKKKLLILFDKIIKDDPKVFLLLVVITILLIVLPTAIMGKYSSKKFLEDLLVQLHGVIIDGLILGACAAWLIKRGQRKQRIRDYTDEINDLRYLKTNEAASKIRGNINRLNDMGIANIDLHHCYLKGAELREVQLKYSDLSFADLRGADFFKAQLQGVDFSNSQFKEATLVLAQIQGAKFEGADLEDTNLSKADLRNSIDLRIEQLSRVKTLYETKLDLSLLDQIKSDYPYLLEEP